MSDVCFSFMLCSIKRKLLKATEEQWLVSGLDMEPIDGYFINTETMHFPADMQRIILTSL